MTILRLPPRTELTPAAQNPTSAPVLVTIAECKRLTNYDESTIYRRIQAGEWQAVGRGRGRRVVWASVERWINEHA